MHSSMSINIQSTVVYCLNFFSLTLILFTKFNEMNLIKQGVNSFINFSGATQTMIWVVIEMTVSMNVKQLSLYLSKYSPTRLSPFKTYRNNFDMRIAKNIS